MTDYNLFMKTILITGSGGYIGSVATSIFLSQGYRVIAIDSGVRGFDGPMEYLKKKYDPDFFIYYHGDIRSEIDRIFTTHSDIDTVIHYAAFCNVGESEKDPSLYFGDSVGTCTALLQAMAEHNIKKIVFSSTCALYGEPQTDTLDETHPISPTHPYGQSKQMCEIVIDWYSKLFGIQYVFMRYFNVCGATDDGEIGDSKKPSFHLMQNAVRGVLGIAPFYLNYTPVPTPDGSPIRDYVNVVDLNMAHVKAVEYLSTIDHNEIFNLGTGTGNSVLEIISAVERITGKTIEKKEGERRLGDASKAIASNGKITSTLGWKPTHTIEDSVRSLVSWYTKHPQGWER